MKKERYQRVKWRPTLDCVAHRCTQTFTKCFPRGMYKITPSPWRCKWADPSHPCQRFSIFFSLKKKQKTFAHIVFVAYMFSVRKIKKKEHKT